MAGVITELRREQGEIAIGSQFQEDVIMVISDMAEMEVQLDVDENDIVSIEIGDPATIEVDALQGQDLSGTVYEISNSAKVTEAQTTNQKTEFEVKVAISEKRPELRPGMTAGADIVTETRESTLSVPIQCVTVRTVEQLKSGKEGKEREESVTGFEADKDGFVQIVFVIEDGKAVARQVETGIQSDTLIEIVSGLQAGATVISGSYRAISRDLVNGATVKVNNDPEKQEKDRNER
jgi:HlyD family secretion protein